MKQFHQKMHHIILFHHINNFMNQFRWFNQRNRWFTSSHVNCGSQKKIPLSLYIYIYRERETKVRLQIQISLWTWGQPRAPHVTYLLWIIMYYSEWITQHLVLFRVNNRECCIIHSEYWILCYSLWIIHDYSE